MKKLAVFAAIVLVALSPAFAAAQTPAAFTGKWEGTFKMQKPDGTEAPPNAIVLNLTQKGNVLTGTAGPVDQQLPVAKGSVTAGKATFEVQPPNGPLFKFAVSIVKGRLTGSMEGTGPDGAVRHAKVDAGKAPAAAKK